MLAVVAMSTTAGAKVVTGSDLAAAKNPIRRVVDLLQAMQKKVVKEGEAEEELYEKFQCYCKTGGADLTAAISAAEQKIPQVTAALESAEASKEQADADIKKAKADRAEGKADLATATALREKEAKAFAKYRGDASTNLSAMKAAIDAIEKGMAGSFLQTAQATILKKLSIDLEMTEADRDMLTAFLSQSQDYAPKSGQIVGILKEMQDTMSKDLADATATEEKAIKDYESLSAAKTAEIEALTASIESNLEKSGKLALEIVAMKEDIDDTTETLNEDKKFLSGLETDCDTKKAEWEERSKTRTEELLAIAETIKILNSDDALELFKKTLPAPSSLLETRVRVKDSARTALKALDAARNKNGFFSDPRVSAIALAMRGGSKSFEKVIKMIDDMVALLAKEQTTDDDKKAYCEKEIDVAEDEKKALDINISDLDKAIADAEESVATLTDELAALAKGIKDLDKSVAEATSTREEENALYKKTMQEDSAAKEILKMAKNRLAKFYAPKMYQPPAKEERSTMGRISEEMAFVQEAPALVEVRSHVQKRADPGPPPQTWDAYKTKSEEHGGVVAMMDLLIGDIDKEITQMTTDEKESQKEYEEMMQLSAEKRTTDSKSMQQKGAEKAELEADLVTMKGELKSKGKELYLKEGQIKDLHLECDWLVANFDMRKEARAGEVDSLKKAKAVLSGADYE
jgi:chromosome segregation ATPase